ncbi:hypothetical protein SNOG_09743 [Parastagonospora nodorum SN15]|uniref:Uncharacterized protein n=1 Tax=Phaeosphaeria nodorum (strain SN15 / ATCC MYA-4574 / FGSC 10173) TaxID=321614 RepID=Q0UES1_PHANO|nr:hypothetical protein SNOG_09743 [Parastagonospora nodorum SN15]EAT83008.1 hypothetical protein SNOG_09743 [Parastagonospora nodorum SN15]
MTPSSQQRIMITRCTPPCRPFRRPRLPIIRPSHKQRKLDIIDGLPRFANAHEAGLPQHLSTRATSSGCYVGSSKICGADAIFCDTEVALRAHEDSIFHNKQADSSEIARDTSLRVDRLQRIGREPRGTRRMPTVRVGQLGPPSP